MDKENGTMVVDDTVNHIRRGVEVRASSLAGASKSKKRKQRELDESQAHESSLHVAATSFQVLEFAVVAGGRSATNRVLTRTLMRTYGWPVKFFKDIPELVSTLYDAVKGERSFFST